MLRGGPWSDDPRKPEIETEKGHIVEFTDATAKFAVDGGAAEYYIAPKEPSAKEVVNVAAVLGVEPAVLDKAKAVKKTRKKK